MGPYHPERQRFQRAQRKPRLLRNARARISTALGSTREVRSGLALAIAFGYVEPDAVQGADARLDRVCAMLYRFLWPR